MWTDTGVFNIEGGCYAKCKDLSRDNEPEIFDAIRFGTVLENVRFPETSRVPDYSDITVTENTRAAYPLQYIPNAVIPAVVAKHPNNIILLVRFSCGQKTLVLDVLPSLQLIVLFLCLHIKDLRRFWGSSTCVTVNAGTSHVPLYRRIYVKNGWN